MNNVGAVLCNNVPGNFCRMDNGVNAGFGNRFEINNIDSFIIIVTFSLSRVKAVITGHFMPTLCEP